MNLTSALTASIPHSKEKNYVKKTGVDNVLNSDQKETFYKNIGDTLKQNYKDTEAWFITSNLESLKHVGLRTSRKIKLYNGSLESRLVKYDIYAGSKKAKYQNND